jgi:hypothetical protein
VNRIASVFILLALVWPAAAGEPVPEPEPRRELIANWLDDRVIERHMPWGIVIDPVYAAPDSEEIVSYTRCGDSAIWTGHYLAAQAYRWNVTRSEQARANIMFALNGIRKLLDVTGTEVLARCVIPVDSPHVPDLTSEESRHGVYSGVVDGIPHFWIGNTSRDQYLGVFFGLTAAWQMVEDQEVHDWVSMLATRILNSLLSSNWNLRMPDGSISTTFLHRPDQQLAMLKLGRRCNPGRFQSAYQMRANSFATSVMAPIAVEIRDTHNSYFKFNLGHITFYNLLTSGDNWWIRTQYTGAFRLLRNATWQHDNAFFDMIETAIQGNDEGRDARVRRLMDEYLDRPRRDEWTDLRPIYPSCEGDDNRACEIVPLVQRVPTDFIWQRSPFQLWGGLYGTIESAAIDYILPYWMARFHGVIAPDPEPEAEAESGPDPE